MICLPSEAKTKICPFWRDTEQLNCLAEECMAWVETYVTMFGGPAPKDGKGYCGKVGK